MNYTGRANMAFWKKSLETYCSSVRNNKHTVNNAESKEFTKISKRLSKESQNHSLWFLGLFCFKRKSGNHLR